MKFAWWPSIFCLIPLIIMLITGLAVLPEYFQYKRYAEDQLVIDCQYIDRILIPYNCTIEYDCKTNDETGGTYDCKQRQDICINIYVVLSWIDPITKEQINQTLFTDATLFVKQLCAYKISTREILLFFFNWEEVAREKLKTVIILSSVSSGLCIFIFVLSIYLSVKKCLSSI